MNVDHLLSLTKKSLSVFGGHFEVDRKNERLEEIVQMEAMEGFWDDADNAAKIQKEKSLLQDVTKTYETLHELSEEFDVLSEFAEEDEASASEAIEVYNKLKEGFNKAEQKVLLRRSGSEQRHYQYKCWSWRYRVL